MKEYDIFELRAIFDEAQGNEMNDTFVSSVREYLLERDPESIRRVTQEAIASVCDDTSLQVATDDISYLRFAVGAVPEQLLLDLQRDLRKKFFELQSEVELCEWEEFELMILLEGASDDEFDEIMAAMTDKRLRLRFITGFLQAWVPDEEVSDEPMVRYIRRHPEQLQEIKRYFIQYHGPWYEVLSFE